MIKHSSYVFTHRELELDRDPGFRVRYVINNMRKELGDDMTLRIAPWYVRDTTIFRAESLEDAKDA